MTTDDENPYASPNGPTIQNGSTYVSQHYWQGRIVTVEGALLASRLWLLTGYAITVDGQERFESVEITSPERFTWQFAHRGHRTVGSFRTFGLSFGITRQYELSLGGESLGTFKVRLKGWWVPYLIAVVIMAVSALVPIAISSP